MEVGVWGEFSYSLFLFIESLHTVDLNVTLMLFG